MRSPDHECATAVAGVLLFSTAHKGSFGCHDERFGQRPHHDPTTTHVLRTRIGEEGPTAVAQDKSHHEKLKYKADTRPNENLRTRLTIDSQVICPVRCPIPCNLAASLAVIRQKATISKLIQGFTCPARRFSLLRHGGDATDKHSTPDKPQSRASGQSVFCLQ